MRTFRVDASSSGGVVFSWPSYDLMNGCSSETFRVAAKSEVHKQSNVASGKYEKRMAAKSAHQTLMRDAVNDDTESNL